MKQARPLVGHDHVCDFDAAGAADHPADVLLALAAFLRSVQQDPAAAVLMKGPFGRATHFYFRTTYDEYYVFSIAEQGFVERREGRPAVGKVWHEVL